MTTDRADVRCRILLRLRAWPAVDDGTAAWLRTLPWRVRRVLLLTHAEVLTQDQAAVKLRLSARTVRRYLDLAYAAYEEAFRGELN